MRRVVKVALISLMLTGLILGCKKGEENTVSNMPQQMPAAPMGQMPQQMPAAPIGQATGQVPVQSRMPPHADAASIATKVEKTTIVPDAVTRKWSKVILD